MKSKAGFTLIEIMVSLLLVGLIAAAAGTSVILGAQAYLFARESNAVTQKAQLAINRINREFLELSDIMADATSNCIIYESPSGKRAIALVGNTIQYYVNPGSTCPIGSGGDILVDSVQNFTINYNGASTWTTSLQKIQDLYAIDFKFDLRRPDTGVVVSFATTVSPRNNNNAGGATLPTGGNPPPEYAGKSCFVATAAYGDANHPIVAVLRDFRDAVLMDSVSGRAFVRYYYRTGPVLAAAIEGNEFACFAVRLLLAPVASLAFFILYCPFVLPFAVFVAWIAARLVIGIFRKSVPRRVFSLRPQRGAILVTLIAAMVVFSSLGAIMLSLFSSSAMSQVAGNNTMRAYYLAESGFRYAASLYVNAADDAARDALLKSIHDQEYVLLSNDGKFRPRIFPYYYVVKTDPSGSTNELVTEVKGGLPFPDSNSYGVDTWIQVRRPDGNISYEQIFTATPSALDNTVRFYRRCGGASCNWDTGVKTGSVVTPACMPDPSRLAIADRDGDGLFDVAFQNATGAVVFPARNGMMTVKMQGSGETRTLAYRELDLTNYLFKGVSDPRGGALTGLSLASNTPIAATKFVRVESTGTIGSGAGAVSRQVTYYAPIGLSSGAAQPKTEFRDPLDTLANWFAGDHLSHIGTHAPVTVDGTGAMGLTGYVETQTSPGSALPKYWENQIGLNWSAAGVPLSQEWLRAGRFLSYDVQAKVKLNLAAPPPAVYFSPGINVRLEDQQNSMGLSLVSAYPGADGSGQDRDLIPDGLSGPISTGRTAFTLWMKEYTKREENITAGDVRSAPRCCNSTCEIGGPPPCGSATLAITPGEAIWNQVLNGERVRFTNTGGALPILQSGERIVEGRDYYLRKVSVVDFGETKRYLYLFDTLQNAINFTAIYWIGLQDITANGSGNTVMIVQDPVWTRLAQQYVSTGSEDSYGILQDYRYPQLKNWVTLLVRLIEAPSVSFVSGGGASGLEIRGGDIVYQTANGLPGGTVTAIARVRIDPVYRSADSDDRRWSSSNAKGVLILDVLKDDGGNNRPYTFIAGALFAGDPPGGLNAGTAGVPGGVTDQVFRGRNNWFAVYAGDPSGFPSADSNPFNTHRGGIPRDQYLWPPDEITATAAYNDRFTAVRFDSYVNSGYCAGFYSKNNTGVGADFIRFTSPDGVKFYSPQSGSTLSTSRPEVGLHAYGSAITVTYFDNFSLQFGPPANVTRPGFLLPIQQ